MYTVRASIDADLPKVYECIKLLLESRTGRSATLLVREMEFREYINAGQLSCLVLVQVTEMPNRTAHSELVGCMIYHKNTSINNGGQGVCLDHMFIKESHREKGNDRLMMRELCFRVLEEGGSHIKFMFQDGLGMENAYTAMGFVNHTKGFEGLQVFEISCAQFSRKFTTIKESDLQLFRGLSIGNTSSQMLAEVWPEIASLGSQILPQPILVIASGNSKNTRGFMQRMLTERKPNDQELVSFDSVSERSELGLPFRLLHLCTFVEEVLVSPRTGRTLYISEFNGDQGVLTAEFLGKRIEERLRDFPNLCKVVVDVPCRVETIKNVDRIEETVKNPGIKGTKDFGLHKVLRQLGAEDISLTEGWNIAYLDQDGMIKLTKDDCKKAK